MHLNRLSLRNFKKYRRAEIKFQDGLTGIVGSNGAGKSTIVEAIAWALYGNKASAIKRDLIKNSNAGDTDSVEVSLSLNQGRQEITITRAMRGKSLIPEASISLDGHRVAVGSREVDQRLEEILKIGYQDFMRTFYARQNDLDNLLKEGGTGKREYLLKLLGLDEIRERSAEQLKSDLRGLEDRKNRLGGALGELGDVEAKIEETSRSIASAKDELSACREIEAQLAAEVEKKKRETDLWAEKQHSHELLSQRISSIESKVAEKKRAINADEVRLREIEGSKMILEELEPRLLRLETVKDRLEKLDPKRKEHDILIQRRIKAKTELDMAKQALADDEKGLDALIQDRYALEKIRPLQIEYQEALEGYEKLEALRDRHTALQMLLKEEKIRLNSTEERIARAEDAVSKILLARDKLAEIALLKKRCEDLQREFISAGRQRELQKEKELLNSRRSVLKDRLDPLEGQTAAIKRDLESIGDLAVMEADLKRNDMELDGLGDELNNGLAELRSEHKIEEARRSEALQNLIKVRGLGADSNCPTCERALGEQYTKLVVKYEAAVAKAGEREADLKRLMKLQMEKIDGVASARSGLKTAFDDLNAKKSKRAELLATLRGLESQISEAGMELKETVKAIESLGEVRFDPERFANLEAEIARLLPHVEEYRCLAIRLEDQPKREAELEDLKKEEQIQIEKLEDIRRGIQALGYVESEYISLKKRLADLKPLHDRFAILSQRVQEIPLAEEKTQRARAQIERLAGIVMRIQNAVVDLGFDPAEHDGLMKERSSLSKAEQSAQAIRLKIAYGPEIRNRLVEASNDLTGLEAQIGEAKEQLSALCYDAGLHEASKTASAQAEMDLDAARKAASNKEIRLGVLEGELQRLKGDDVRKKEYERDLEETCRRMQVVDVTRGVVNRFMDHILIRIRDDIAGSAGAILEEVSGRYSLLKIDDDFNILVEDRGDYYPILRYSGGETDMIAVSVRVAISEYLMRFGPEGEGYSFLILDEIFGSQDMEHRENMINMLRSLQERFPQIIAISHISDVQGQFDNTITVIEDELGNSKIEQN
jgi:exonuclease SbcC